MSVIYKISVTNLEFTLGLTTNDKDSKQLFYPMSLRVGDSSVEKSGSGEVVDFIFCKDGSLSKYNEILVRDHYKKIPDSVLSLLDENLTREYK